MQFIFIGNYFLLLKESIYGRNFVKVIMYFYRAMELLERGLLSSPANFYIKILLIRIYLEAGLIGAADHVFTLLDVKHIQLDSLGYLHSPLLAPLGHLSLASITLDHTTKFFIANYKDVCICMLYNILHKKFYLIQL